jgi:serine/threonine protein kinase
VYGKYDTFLILTNKIQTVIDLSEIQYICALKFINLPYGSVDQSDAASREIDNIYLVPKRHDNIVKYYGWFPFKLLNQSCYAVVGMELCDMTLKQYMMSAEYRSFGELERAQMRWSALRQIAAALSSCHRAQEPLMHRDIKPDNGELSTFICLMSVLILIDKKSGTYVIKLGDFGIARRTSNGGQVGSIPGGHIDYRAPEILKGEIYDEKADMYSLGVLMWEMESDPSHWKWMGIAKNLLSINPQSRMSASEVCDRAGQVWNEIRPVPQFTNVA